LTGHVGTKGQVVVPKSMLIGGIASQTGMTRFGGI
jgi:hypothetical protein